MINKLRSLRLYKIHSLNTKSTSTNIEQIFLKFEIVNVRTNDFTDKNNGNPRACFL